MTITHTTLIRASGGAAMAAGAIFAAVQIGHPKLTVASVATTNVEVRDSLKVLMCALALVGITGMYLSQVRRNGLLGLIGYLVLAAGYLGIMCVVFAAAYVLPEVTGSNPGFVHDVIAVDTNRGTVNGDIGPLKTVILLQGFAYVVGGVLFGLALYRAHVLARWAAVLLAIGGVAAAVLGLMPDAYYRLLAYPNAIAMIGLGYSLWRTAQPTATTHPATSPAPAPTVQPPAAGSTEPSVVPGKSSA
jgi:hypothetical protein